MIRTLASAALLGGLVLAVAGLSRPMPVAAFTLSGDQLDLTQRDFRVVNSFSDPESNDNTVKQAEFPGTLGAPLAIRKAHSEWSSGPWAGTGLGDGSPSNPVLGSGNANFDNSWQGLTTGGDNNGNFHIAIPGSSGGTLAFTVTPTSDGWKIVYYDGIGIWSDGPGDTTSGLDLQGVATHEIGHVLGLGHSNVPGATMGPAISGVGNGYRSIEADDVAALQAVYGVKSPDKPRIDAVSGDHVVGGTLTIDGVNFALVNNEVWFTAAAASGEPIKVSGVAALDAGETLQLTVPEGVAPGEILVRSSGANDGSVLSNAFPFDVPLGFSEIHPGFSSVGGDPPLLTAEGDATPGEHFEIQLSGAFALKTGLLFVAPAQGSLPLKGGTLYAVPIAFTLVIVTDAGGGLSATGGIPLGTPSGSVIVTQAGFAFSGGPTGVQLSNGLRIDVP